VGLSIPLNSTLLSLPHGSSVRCRTKPSMKSSGIGVSSDVVCVVLAGSAVVVLSVSVSVTGVELGWVVWVVFGVNNTHTEPTL